MLFMLLTIEYSPCYRQNLVFIHISYAYKNFEWPPFYLCYLKIYYSAINNSGMQWSHGSGEGLNDKWQNRGNIHIEELYGLNGSFQKFMHVQTVPMHSQI